MNAELLVNYVRETLLNERRSGRKILHTLKNRIARDIMRVVTGQLSKVSVATSEREDHGYNEDDVMSSYALEGYEWEKKIVHGPSGEEYPTIDVNVVVVEDPSRKQFNVSGESIEGRTIDIVIEFPVDWLSKNFQTLYAELSNTIFHELEHLTQSGELASFDRGERYYEFETIGEPTSSFAAKYLLEPTEVPAHVMGYSDVATSMADLKDLMQRDLENYNRLGHITKNDEQVVLSGWMDWAERNLHSKRFGG